jgi:hypothetical protein
MVTLLAQQTDNQSIQPKRFAMRTNLDADNYGRLARPGRKTLNAPKATGGLRVSTFF